MCWILHQISTGNLLCAPNAKIEKCKAKNFRQQMRVDSSDSDSESDVSQHGDTIAYMSMGVIVKRSSIVDREEYKRLQGSFSGPQDAKRDGSFSEQREPFKDGGTMADN